MKPEHEIPIRVLIAKVGLDGHERGARVVTFGLREEGMEVIYTGIRQSIAAIVETALQEDVDVVGLSCLSGAHDLFPEIAEAMRASGRNDVLIIGGGVIPDDDVPLLKEKGISAVFGPGTPIQEIATYIRENVKKRFHRTGCEGSTGRRL